eukprot:1159372-Pelagomonas_calceolata.AAC.3
MATVDSERADITARRFLFNKRAQMHVHAPWSIDAGAVYFMLHRQSLCACLPDVSSAAYALMEIQLDESKRPPA